MNADSPPQHVIVHDKPEERGVVYTTAYTQGQVQQGITRARASGRQKVRSMLARDHAREFSR